MSKFKAFGFKIKKTKTNRKFQISPILKFWIVLGRSAILLGRFGWICVVSAGFDWFRVVAAYSVQVLVSTNYINEINSVV